MSDPYQQLGIYPNMWLSYVMLYNFMTFIFLHWGVKASDFYYTAFINNKDFHVFHI